MRKLTYLLAIGIFLLGLFISEGTSFSYQKNRKALEALNKAVPGTASIVDKVTSLLDNKSALEEIRDKLAELSEDDAPTLAISASDDGVPETDVIALGDIIDVNVYGSETMHDPPIRFRISANGSVFFPLIGEVELVGLSSVEASEKLNALLLDGYLTDPQVTVFLIGRPGLKSGIFSIRGAVAQPENYSVKQEISLTAAIAAAGGPTGDAIISGVRIIRTDSEGNEEEIIADLYEDGMDILIQEGDDIIVDSYGTFFIYGQVGRPGKYSVTEDLQVADAVLNAGGFTSTASKNGVKVIRVMADGKRKIFKVPVAHIFRTGKKSKDVYLEDEDIVIVAESIF